MKKIFTQLIKNLSPQGLLGRSFLIMALPIILAQGVTSYIFFNHHWDTLGRRLAVTLSNEIVMLVEAEAKGHPYVDDMAQKLGITITRSQKMLPMDPSVGVVHWLQSLLDREGFLRRELESRLLYPLSIVSDQEWIVITVLLNDRQITLTTTQKKIFSNTVFVYVIWSVALCVLLVMVAWVFMRNQMRPIRDLAMAAEAFGQQGSPKRLKPRGAIEVRKATRAFNAMQDNLLHNITERTEMLAGISHDLRTPLTRLRLALEMVPRDIKEDLLPDVIDMQAMVDSYLAFAREDHGEDWQPVALNAFFEALKKQLNDQRLSLTAPPNVNVRAKPLLLKRCFINLINNALHYGTLCQVAAHVDGKYVDVIVTDNGRGMSIPEFDRAKHPFVRLNDERPIEGGHVGLGLSIAEDIAKRHGHSLKLDASYADGARIVVRLARV